MATKKTPVAPVVLTTTVAPEVAVGALAALPAFSKPVADLSLVEQVESYSTAHFVEELAKSRRESVRESLLAAAEKNGSPNEKGGSKLVVENHTVLREKRTSSSPDEKKLMKLLESKQLAVEDAFDKVMVMQANPSKVAKLVETGHITAEEAAQLYKVTFACVVHPSAQFEALLENAVPASATPEKKTRK